MEHKIRKLPIIVLTSFFMIINFSVMAEPRNDSPQNTTALEFKAKIQNCDQLMTATMTEDERLLAATKCSGGKALCSGSCCKSDEKCCCAGFYCGCTSKNNKCP